MQKRVPGDLGGTRMMSTEDPTTISLRGLTLAALASCGVGHSEEPQVSRCLLWDWGESKEVTQQLVDASSYFGTLASETDNWGPFRTLHLASEETEAQRREVTAEI